MMRLDKELECGYIGSLFPPGPKAMLRLYILLKEDASRRSFIPSSRLPSILAA